MFWEIKIWKEIARNPELVRQMVSSTFKHKDYAPTLEISSSVTGDQRKILKRRYYTSSQTATLALLSEDISNNFIRLLPNEKMNGENLPIDSSLCKYLAKFSDYQSRTLKYAL